MMTGVAGMARLARGVVLVGGARLRCIRPLAFTDTRGLPLDAPRVVIDTFSSVV
jgi:hypothetical protein